MKHEWMERIIIIFHFRIRLLARLVKHNFTNLANFYYHFFTFLRFLCLFPMAKSKVWRRILTQCSSLNVFSFSFFCGLLRIFPARKIKVKIFENFFFPLVKQKQKTTNYRMNSNNNNGPIHKWHMILIIIIIIIMMRLNKHNNTILLTLTLIFFFSFIPFNLQIWIQMMKFNGSKRKKIISFIIIVIIIYPKQTNNFFSVCVPHLQFGKKIIIKIVYKRNEMKRMKVNQIKKKRLTLYKHFKNSIHFFNRQQLSSY